MGDSKLLSSPVVALAPLTGELSESELLHLIALQRILYSKPLALVSLLTTFGSAEAVFASGTRQNLERAGLKDQLIAEILLNRRDHECHAQRSLDWLNTEHHYLIGSGDEIYPALLREIAVPPPLLFAAGKLEAIKQIKFAIVGSRNPTRSGKQTAWDFAFELADMGMAIVSGMAKGIDSQAHKGALEAKGLTIAVLGTGCDLTYPPGQKALKAEICESGLLLSEFPLGTPAWKHHFPQRNRIVTGLSTGTLMVEGTLKSGSMISARLAMEQGREVFSVPGSIFSIQSRGCHELIRNGAKLTESVADILQELQGMVQFELEIAGQRLGPEKQMQSSKVLEMAAEKMTLNEKEKKLVSLMDYQAVQLDELCVRTGMRVQDVASLLTVLEIRGIVKADVMGYSLAPGKIL